MYTIFMYTIPQSLRIGVLRGGLSSEYDVSLKSGANVLRHLSETHKPIDIFISKRGIWHMQGVEKLPERILPHVDVVWNALHGTYGEDGKVQELLNRHGIPYTGSDRFSSAIAMNKWMTKERIIRAGIKTPIYTRIRRDDLLQTSLLEIAKEILNSMPHPLVVKPVTGGSSIGLYIVKSFDELLFALNSVLSEYPGVLIEEYISGKDVSCAILQNFRERDIYSFPPTEKTLTREESKSVETIAKKIHKILNLSHYSQSDFIASPRRGVYFLEVDTLPTMTEESLLPKSLDVVGVPMKEFLHHVIYLALSEK